MLEWMLEWRKVEIRKTKYAMKYAVWYINYFGYLVLFTFTSTLFRKVFRICYSNTPTQHHPGTLRIRSPTPPPSTHKLDTSNLQTYNPPPPIHHELRVQTRQYRPQHPLPHFRHSIDLPTVHPDHGFFTITHGQWVGTERRSPSHI